MSKKRGRTPNPSDVIPWKQIQIERQRIGFELAREFNGFTQGALIQELGAYWSEVTEEMDTYRQSLDVVSPQAERFHAAAAELQHRQDPALIPLCIKWLAMPDQRRRIFAVNMLQHFARKEHLGDEQTNVANALMKYLKESLTNREVASDCQAALEAITFIGGRLALEAIDLVLANAESCTRQLVCTAVIRTNELADNSFELEADHLNALAWVKAELLRT
jgi:hypothetical protein